MSVSEELYKLVERFDQGYEAYKSKEYSEAQVRVDFINPLMVLLGWDVDNAQGRPEAYRDVIYEDRVKVGGGTKAPDYGFYTGGARRFFLEAKKPSVDLQNDVNPAVQLRRYAWSAKLPLSILTDFEEFAFYDCRFEPMKNDKPITARLDFLTYDQYPDRWDDIYGVFSREAVLSGSFDKYAASTERRRGVDTVNTAFLREIESWREALAQDIALKNNLSRRQLNYAVQMTIDRIIFLRMAEDRGVEDYGRLLGNVDGSGVYERMCNLFRDADDRYNSGLFHFRKERGRNEEPDEFTTSLAIDDAVLQRIVRGLYYPESPYEFSVLPLDVLGQVYEQFLGKVIHLEDGNRATVEEKPEVRKAGGVYYTPTYIVDYIVENTVGKLLEDKRPGPRGGARKLKIVDPACGSGSFLIGAYEYLLDWHRDRYLEDGPEKHTKEIYEGPGGQYHLTIDEKKRILLNNIYGVDIDPQAVEVTKLSLLLKVLEGESSDSITRQLSLIQERALPDLDNNIKCGNSLIGKDFYDEQDLALFSEDDEYRINVFDWREAFPQVFEGSDPGFDAVIGNPPYIRIQALREFAPIEVDHYKRTYRSAQKGNYDIYVVFVERGLDLLNKSGRLGYILPSKFLSTDYGVLLRSLLSEAGVVDRIVDFGHEQVFKGATTYTCLLFLNRNMPTKITYQRLAPEQLERSTEEQTEAIPSKSLGGEAWLLGDETTQTLLEKLKQVSTPLLGLPAGMSRGSSTGADDVFCLKQDGRELVTRRGETVEVEDDLLRQPLYATDFTRYMFRLRNDERIIFPYTVLENGYQIIEESELQKRYPKAYEYLRTQKQKLESRKQYRYWYGYSAPRNLHVHDHADVLVPLLADRGLFAPMPVEPSQFCVMASGGFSVSLSSTEGAVSPLYVLGLTNSKLLFWNLRLISNKFRGGWITCTKQYFGTLPIRTIDFSNPEDAARHEQMVGLVDRMLSLNERLAEAKIGQERGMIQRQIEATDRQIDKLVYELYDLNEEEIAVVTGATQANP